MKKEEKINLKLLELNFQRYLSRAHTAFEVGVGLIPTIILGVVGVFFALHQVNVVILNKFYITQFSIPTISIIMLIGSLMVWSIFNSRNHRNKIESLIKKIRDTKINLNLT